VAPDHIVAFDTIIAFIIPLVALLTSVGVWRKNTFGILVYSKDYPLFNLVYEWDVKAVLLVIISLK
jgi:hypothetical protein